MVLLQHSFMSLLFHFCPLEKADTRSDTVSSPAGKAGIAGEAGK